MKLEGGCLCGALRYEIDTTANDVADYCHCTQCRKASGAPVVAWIQVAPDRFRLMRGSGQPFRSSPDATRWFCSSCGSPVYMTDSSGKSVGVTLGTLDNPEHVRPTVHGWESQRIDWFDLTDMLPRYADHPPYDL
jgi:hypothetical protein